MGGLKTIAVIIALLAMSIHVYGHPGRTNADGCHYCRTNCEQYGLQTDEYHCHNETTTSIAAEIQESTSTTKTTSSTTSKKTTTTIKKTSSTTSSINAEQFTGEAVKLVNEPENIIEKDIYREKANNVVYESSDYKARRLALYFFNFILILVLIKFIIRK